MKNVGFPGTVAMVALLALTLTACGVPAKPATGKLSTTAALANATKRVGFQVRIPHWMPPGGHILSMQVTLPTAAEAAQPGGGAHFKKVYILLGANIGHSFWRIQLFEEWSHGTLYGPGVKTVSVDGLPVQEQNQPNPNISGAVLLNAPGGISYLAIGVHVPLQDLARAVVSIVR